MPSDESQRARSFTVAKQGDDWFIESSDGCDMGAFRKAVMALQVATIEVLSARKQGQETTLLVQDDCGSTHRCELTEALYSSALCSACEVSWSTASVPLRPKCPMWETLRASGERRT